MFIEEISFLANYLQCINKYTQTSKQAKQTKKKQMDSMIGKQQS